MPEGDTGALAGRGEGLLVERMPRYDSLLPRAGLLDLRVGRVELVDGLAQAANVEELDLHVARAGQQVDAVDRVPARLQHRRVVSLHLEDGPRGGASRVPDPDRVVLTAGDDEALERVPVDRVDLGVMLLEHHLLSARSEVEDPRRAVV